MPYNFVAHFDTNPGQSDNVAEDATVNGFNPVVASYALRGPNGLVEVVTPSDAGVVGMAQAWAADIQNSLQQTFPNAVATLTSVVKTATVENDSTLYTNGG